LSDLPVALFCRGRTAEISLAYQATQFAMAMLSRRELNAMKII
jgi:hypothetical protein